MKRQAGLTLAEAMITMALISLALALTAGLMSLYSKGARIKGVQGVSTAALKAVLHDIRSEAVGAVEFDSPPSESSAWSNILGFSKVDRSSTTRLQSFPADWTPYDLTGTSIPNDFLVRVRYELINGALSRGVRRVGESSFRFSPVIESKVEQFQCRLGVDGSLELSIEVRGNVRNPVYQSKSMRRVR